MEPVIKSLLTLRDKNGNMTFKAIVEELSNTQYNLLKQLLNVHDKAFYRQLTDYQNYLT